MLFSTLIAAILLVEASASGLASHHHQFQLLSGAQPRHGASRRNAKFQFRAKARQMVKRDGEQAYMKCTSSTTWQLCGNGSCTDMGSVAPGTVCENDAIAMAPAAGAAPVSSPATTSPSTASDSTPSDASTSSTDAAPTVPVLARVSRKKAAALAAGSSSTSDSSSSTPAPSAADVAAAPVLNAAAPPAVAVPAVVLPTPAPAPAPAPVSAPAAGGNNGPFTDGKGTFFTQDGGTGACGHAHQDTEYIVALDLVRYGNLSNNAPDCGRTVSITNNANGKTVSATVADACPGCSNFNSIDLSVAAFNAIADPATGVIGITWSFTS